MPAYYYEAVYANGEKGDGVVEAASKDEAVAQVRQTYDVVLELREIKGEKTDVLEKYRKINMKAFALVCKQFSIILKAGMPLIQTVSMVAMQTSDKALKRMLKQVAEDIANGWSLSYSFEKRGGSKLPSTFTETVRSGEESGDLVTAFDRMSVYYERMNKTRAKATSAMIYPTFILIVAALVVMVIMTYAIPSFTKTFESMNIELPLPSRIIIAVSNFLQSYFCVILLVVALIVIGVKLYGKTAKGMVLLAKWKLSIPVIGDIASMASASQFAHTMSIMIASGMPILNALRIASRAISNPCVASEIESVIPGVEAGQSLGECMANCKELPNMLVQMTAMGEATGSMEHILEILGEYYDNEVDVKTAKALTLLEPMIICILAVVVVAILLAIYLPMFSMYGSI